MRFSHLVLTNIICANLIYYDTQAKDVRQLYKYEMRQALQALEINKYNLITIYKLDPAHALNKKENTVILACTNGSTVWLNEDELSKSSLETARFTFYHEAAHIKLNHTFKRNLFKITCSISNLFLYGYIIYNITKLIKNCYKLERLESQVKDAINIAGLEAFACALNLIIKFVDKELAKKYEKDADLLACKKLCEQKKVETIIKWLTQLKQSVMKNGNFQFDQRDSTYDQIKYLENFLISYFV